MNYNIKYFFPRLGHFYDDIRYRVRQKFQRTIRGYADSDLWNMDGFLAEFLYKMMDRFIKSKRMGYPADFDPDREYSEEDDEKTIQEWEKTLAKIREGFQAANDLCDENFDWNKYPVDREDLDLVCHRKPMTPEQEKQSKERYEQYDIWAKEKRKVFEEGMDLFKKHFFALWD